MSFVKLDSLLTFLQKSSPWTNVYGLARSLIAGSLLVTLLLNDVRTFFRPIAGVDEYPVCSAFQISFFCLFSFEYLWLAKWIAIVLLAIIASGWRPRYTGVLHWWLAASFQNSATTLDGGEQVAVVLTLLLVPITLLDGRRWHWQGVRNEVTTVWELHKRMIVWVTVVFLKIQMALIYFNAGIARLSNPEWIEGTALYYFFQHQMLGLNPAAFDLLSPLLLSNTVFFITWSVTIVEILLGAALFASRKYIHWFFYLGVALHVGIALLLGLFSFSTVMIAGLILAFRPFTQPYLLSFLRTKGDTVTSKPLERAEYTDALNS